MAQDETNYSIPAFLSANPIRKDPVLWSILTCLYEELALQGKEERDVWVATKGKPIKSHLRPNEVCMSLRAISAKTGISKDKVKRCIENALFKQFLRVDSATAIFALQPIEIIGAKPFDSGKSETALKRPVALFPILGTQIPEIIEEQAVAPSCRAFSENQPELSVTTKEQAVAPSEQPKMKTVEKSQKIEKVPGLFADLPKIEEVAPEVKKPVQKQTKNQSPELPFWLDEELWKEFLLMRQRIRKPMTPFAQKLAIKRLESLRVKGHKAEDVLLQSILNSWQGLFEPKTYEKSDNFSNRSQPQSPYGRSRVVNMPEDSDIPY